MTTSAGAQHPGDETDLVALYYRHAPAEDRISDDPAERAAAVRAHRALAADRVPGRALVRLLNPTRSADGWTTPETVVQIVTDDMPYLVDSVVSQLSRTGLTIHRFVHPIVVVRRSLSGALQQVLTEATADQLPPGAIAESWMYLEIDRISDPERARQIQHQVLAVLTDVREVVEDTERMICGALAIADELQATPPPLPDDEIAEGVALLRWLAAGHFTFLGYRYDELVRDPGRDPAGDLAGDLAPGEPVLRPALASGLGVLRRDSLAVRSSLLDEPEPGSDDHPKAPRLLVLTQASAPSTIYRPLYPYYLGVRTFDQDGQVSGEHRFVGVLTTSALHADVRDIPVVRTRVQEVFRRAGVPQESYSGQRMLEVIQAYPHSELFSVDTELLYETVTGVLALTQRRTVRLFCRRDPYGRFFSCLVYLPRDRYTTRARLAMQRVLVRELRGTGVDYNARIDETLHARVHFTVRTDPADLRVPVAPDVATLTEQLADAVRTWEDRLTDTVHAETVHAATRGDLTTDLAVTAEVVQHYLTAFPEAYKEDFDPATAVVDIARLEALTVPDGMDLSFYRPAQDGPGPEPGERRFKLYLAGQRITLSQVLPVLARMDVEIVEERPYPVVRGDGVQCWIYDFGLRMDACLLEDLNGQDPDDVRRRFQDAFVAAWRGECEVDRFNALVLHAGLSWRQAVVLRAYVRYLRQGGTPYSLDYVEDVLIAHSRIAAALVALFEARFDPEPAPHPGDPALAREVRYEELVVEVATLIDQVTGLDADRILQNLLSLVRATLRTNYYVTDRAGIPRPYLAVKLDPGAVAELPDPRPQFEIFVCSPRVEGVHLRFGPVARGGLRWSDRREDFRTEILGLAKAQAVKNAVIVPVGAKGGFVVKRPPAPTGDPDLDRDALQAEGVACYRMFVSGLLDLTDNLVDNTTVHPAGVVCHDGDDSYLVIAADKGTATFSDIANEIATSYGFWLGDAFASGGSSGYDHKAMGITARGAWASVRRHFRELGIDSQADPFTVVGIGDLSGDVFGNGMLCSDRIRLLAAFDHRHVFVDPDPDPDRSYGERRRLRALPRSSWDDYDRAAISPGGGVWPRTVKRIPISAPMRQALGIADGITELSPPELIRAILLSPAQLLFNGGIGTYVKAESETHADVGDKANDALRVNGAELRVRVIAEGGNLGVTQRGRIEFARAGGKINTDAIDNSAGVDCSDHEVNIKILLDRLVACGVLTVAARNRLLVEMTDQVAALVLADNQSQNTLLGVSRAHTADIVAVHARLVRHLEAERGLDRRLEALPTRVQFSALESAGRGLTSPELAVLLAHVKLALRDEVLPSDLPDLETFRARLPEYFPAPLPEWYPEAIRAHPLRREITTTLLVNEVVDGGGITYAFRLAEELSVSATDAMRAYRVATEVFDLPATWRQIAELGTAVPIAVADGMMLELRRLLDRTSRWLLLRRPQPLAVAAEISRFRPFVRALAPRVAGWLVGRERERVLTEADRLTGLGVPRELACRVTAALHTFSLLDVVEVTELGEGETADVIELSERDVGRVAELYYRLLARLDIDRLLGWISELPRDNRWDSLARLALRDDLYSALREITLDVLRSGDIWDDPDALIEQWEWNNATRLARARAAVNEISDGSVAGLDLPALSVVVRSLTRP